MGTPTKVYSLFEILLSLIRVYPKREFQVSKRELVNDMCLIHGMVGKVINHTLGLNLFVLYFLFYTNFYPNYYQYPTVLLYSLLAFEHPDMMMAK